jgi:hypothetical protein
MMSQSMIAAVSSARSTLDWLGSRSSSSKEPDWLWSDDPPQSINPCGQSGLDTLIGAASAVGGFAQDVGDVGQIIGGAVAFVNPVLGGAIFTGSKVISGVGTGLEVGAALGDAYLNGNTGGLANVGVSAVGGLVGGAAFNRLRALEFGGRVGRNALGQFTRHPANQYAKEIERAGNLVGSKAAGSAVCR